MGYTTSSHDDARAPANRSNKEECDEPIHPSTNYLGGVTHAGPIHNQWNVKNLNRDESNWLIDMPNNTFFLHRGKIK
jgi:hypothetical protein